MIPPHDICILILNEPTFGYITFFNVHLVCSSSNRKETNIFLGVLLIYQPESTVNPSLVSQYGYAELSKKDRS